MNVNTVIAIVMLVVAVVALGMVAWNQNIQSEYLREELQTSEPLRFVDEYKNTKVREIIRKTVELEKGVEQAQTQAESITKEAEALRENVNTLEGIIATFKDEKSKLDELVTGKNKEIDQFKEEISRLQEKINEPDEQLRITKNDLKEYKLQAEDLNREIKRVSQSFYAYKESAEDIQRGLQIKIEQLKEALNKYKGIEANRDTRDTEQYDGEVLEVDIDRRFAVINLGSVNRVKRGMQFDVIRWRFNRWEKMGKIEVTKVFPATSTVTILTQVEQKMVCPLTGFVGEKGMRYSPFAAGGDNSDKVVELVPTETVETDTMEAFDPILQGDKITNPFYSPSKTLAFAIAGEPEQFSREELANLIEYNGGKVLQDVGVEADYLVLCKVPDQASATSKERIALLEETQKAMDAAKQFGVPVMREVELLNLFQR